MKVVSKHVLLVVVVLQTLALSSAIGGKARSKMKARAKPEKQECMGLPAETCKPCPDGGPGDFCDNTDWQCNQLFCHPLCSKTTWEIKTEASGGPVGLAAEVNSEPVQKALTSQFVSWGCAKKMQCCDTKLMVDWVENHVYQDQYPNPLIPVRSCKHDPDVQASSQELCNECKSAVKVKVKPLECPESLKQPADAEAFLQLAEAYRTIDPGFDIESFDGMYLVERSSSTLEVGRGGTLVYRPTLRPGVAQYETRTMLNRMLRFPMRDQTKLPGILTPAGHVSLLDVSAKANILHRDRMRLSLGAGGDHYDVGDGAHKSFYFRCKKMEEKVKEKASSLESEFNAKVCGCLGCCEEPCFFPTVINTIEEIEFGSIKTGLE